MKMKMKKVKRNKGFTLVECLTVAVIGLSLILVFGWGLNIYKLATKCDFDGKQSSWKAEVVRGVGIPVGPLGAIVGFMNFDEEK